MGSPRTPRLAVGDTVMADRYANTGLETARVCILTPSGDQAFIAFTNGVISWRDSKELITEAVWVSRLLAE